MSDQGRSTFIAALVAALAFVLMVQLRSLIEAKLPRLDQIVSPLQTAP